MTTKFGTIQLSVREQPAISKEPAISTLIVKRPNKTENACKKYLVDAKLVGNATSISSLAAQVEQETAKNDHYNENDEPKVHI